MAEAAKIQEDCLQISRIKKRQSQVAVALNRLNSGKKTCKQPLTLRFRMVKTFNLNFTGYFLSSSKLTSLHSIHILLTV